MRRVLAIPSFIGFFVSLVLHTAAWMGINGVGVGEGIFFAIHIAAIINTFPFNWALKAEGLKQKQNGFINDVTAPMPEYARVLLGGFRYYIIVNFMLGFVAIFMGFGSLAGEAHFMRVFSGHWMWFFLLPAFYFWFPRDKAKIKAKTKPKRSPVE